MKYVDFAVQSILIGLTLIMLISLLFIKDSVSLIYIAQFILGVWQFGGAIISLLIKTPGSLFKTKYLIISSSYLVSIAAIIYALATTSFQWAYMVYWIYITLLAWILAIYYYTITWRLVFAAHKQRSSFLPHINF